MDPNKYVYHLDAKCKMPKNVILCGKRKRVEKISQQWLESSECLQDGDYLVYRGKRDGKEIAAIATGIGAPATSIAVAEAVVLGARRFLRIGSCGSMQENVKVGDIIIPTGAARNDGISDFLAPRGFPAVPSHNLYSGLISEAETILKKIQNIKIHTGIVDSLAEFGLEFPEMIPNTEWATQRRVEAKNTGILANEMECAGLFIKAASLSHFAKEQISSAAILYVVGDASDSKPYVLTDRAIESARRAEEAAIEIGLGALCLSD